ncbi:MAG: response regulator [Myxococcales bacterium]
MAEAVTAGLGRVLVSRGLLDDTSLRAALEGKPGGAAFIARLLAAGSIGEPELLEALSEFLGMPAVDLSRTVIDLSVLDTVPRHVAEADRMLPLSREGGRLHIAVDGTGYSQQTLDEVQFVTGLLVSHYAALPNRLEGTILAAYDARDQGETTYRGSAAPPDAEEVMAVIAPDAERAVVSAPLEGLEGEVLDLDERILEVESGPSDDEEVMHRERVRVGPPRILAVDDEPEIVRMLEKALTSAGYLVDTAADGKEAEQKLAADPPYDLVLLDAMLPQVHGFEICSRIKGNPRLRQVPVVMMSAVYRGWRFAQDARETFGADDYIEKPFHLSDILRRVQERISAPPRPLPEQRDAADRSYQEGLRLVEAGKPEEARAALEQSVKADPFSARGYFALAQALKQIGEPFRAISSYEKAVELRPKHFAALTNLAELYLEKGFRRKAVETLERAVLAAPDGKTREAVRARLVRLL